MLHTEGTSDKLRACRQMPPLIHGNIFAAACRDALLQALSLEQLCLTARVIQSAVPSKLWNWLIVNVSTPVPECFPCHQHSTHSYNECHADEYQTDTQKLEYKHKYQVKNAQ